MINKLKLDKEKLQFIKLYLENYKKILLKEKDNKIGINIRISCNIAELINVLNYYIGDFVEVLKYEFENRYIGNVMAVKENFPEKSNKEIIERLESLLCVTNLPAYELESIMFGLWELKKRIDQKKEV